MTSFFTSSCTSTLNSSCILRDHCNYMATFSLKMATFVTVQGAQLDLSNIPTQSTPVKDYNID